MAVVTHTIHQYLRIMKKLENPKLEDCRDYLRKEVMPRLQGMQRDLFGDEYLTINVSIGPNGEYVTAYAAIMKCGEMQDNIFVHLCVYDSREKIDFEYGKLLNFLVLYQAS